MYDTIITNRVNRVSFRVNSNEKYKMLSYLQVAFRYRIHSYFCNVRLFIYWNYSNFAYQI